MKEHLQPPQPLPEMIKQALTSEPLVVNENLIGTQLRNAAELQDLRAELSKLKDPNYKAVGLVGSRTEGRLVYSPHQLALKLYYDYQQAHAFDLTETEQWYLDNEVWDKMSNQVAPLADWLATQAAHVESLNDINLNLLPSDLLRFILIVPWVKPVVFPQLQQRIHDLETPQLPYPGALFPDIDVWTVSEGKNSMSIFDASKGRLVVGSASGALIQIHHLLTHPDQTDDDLHQAENALSQFRPLRF